MKKALITGITGQDGSYLAEFLLKKGYQVHGLRRRSSSVNTGRIDDLYENPEYHEKQLFLHYGDLIDSSSLSRIVDRIKPDEIYNLAAQSNVGVSFMQPEYTADVNGLGVLRLLEAVQRSSPATRFYQASTSEIFGNNSGQPLNEQSGFTPCSPYGCAKLYAYWITRNYREASGMFACNGILFNHESPRRGENFVTRKITRAVARISRGAEEQVRLGNLDARRDWGYAPEYVRGMWLMLQQDAAEDFVLATGETHSVREFVSCAFETVGINLNWQGTGTEEFALRADTGQPVVVVDPDYYRPLDLKSLVGDPSKAEEKLGWKADSSFEQLVEIMVRADLDRIDRDV